MNKLFIAPIVVSLLVLVGVYIWGGIAAFLLAGALAALEITLSFDNAVVNAAVLKKMSPAWQRRFLTWGMLISVVGVRLILPILIVSAVAALSPLFIAHLAFFDPLFYSKLLENAGPAIQAFGGSFLLLVALDYFLDGGKTVHWLRLLERRLVRWGQVEALGIAIVLAALLTLAFLSPHAPFLILKSGIVGVILYVLVRGITDAFGMETQGALQAGAALFFYINILDTAFSLDGVVGAFALTTSLPIIVVGLGIGAYFVRAMTISLVRGGTLNKFVYLENGAHWAIFALGLCMFGGLVTHIPEWFIASIGLVLIMLSFFSSQRHLASVRDARPL